MEIMNRKELQLHLKEKCYFRPYWCEYCGLQETYTAITGETRFFRHCDNHYSVCPQYPLPCSNGCHATGIKRKAMSDHHSSCPLELLSCPFRDAGCCVKILRKDMEDHMTANQQQHMVIAFESLNFRCICLAKEIDVLEETIKDKTNTPDCTALALRRMRSVLQPNLGKIGDKVTFRVTNFAFLKREKKA